MAGIRAKECVSTRGDLTGRAGEKSAEAIIPGNREGLNNRKSEETEEGGQYGESRIPRERGLPAKG